MRQQRPKEVHEMKEVVALLTVCTERGESLLEAAVRRNTEARKSLSESLWQP